MRQFFVYSLLLVLLASCERDAGIDLPYEGDKIVLNSFIQPDSLVYIRVTRSKPVSVSGNLQFQELENARLSIQENGTALPAPRWQVINGRGYFVTASPAKPGARYKISATTTDMGTAVAGDSLPPKPSITDASAAMSTSRVRFVLHDNGAVKDYYRIRLYEAGQSGTKTVRGPRISFRLDPSFNDNFLDVIGDTYYADVNLNDGRVNGKDVVVVLQTQQAIKSRHLLLEVSGLSEGAFKYLQATASQRENQDDMDNFIMDPVRIYSNVKNGYGIVAGINASVITFEAK